MMRNSHKKTLLSGGYISLIELLVVLFIITLFAFIVIPNLERGERRQLLRRATLQLVQDFRDMQERAIASRDLPGSEECPQGGGTKIPAGYGVHFRNTLGDDRYLLFADCNGNNFFDGFESSLLNPSGGNLERVFPPGIVLDEMRIANESGGALGGSRARIDVTYAPPDPSITLRAEDGTTAPQAWYRLMVRGGSCPADCSTVWASVTGRIFIE